jgi:hypothetical protein
LRTPKKEAKDEPPEDGELSEEQTGNNTEDEEEQFEICIPSTDEAPVENENDVEEHTYTVKNIPESLTVNTLLRQFLKPKPYGPVISRSDLDAEKMAPFFEAGMDHVMLYMKVPVGPNERFYLIDKTKPILENLRNCFIQGHPEFIITLDNDFNHFQTLSEEEAHELQNARREDYRQKMSEKRQHSGPSNFRPHFSRDGHGGGNGGRFDRRNFNGSRGGPRGKGFRGNRGGRNFQNGRRNDFDPYEHYMDTDPRMIRPTDYAPSSKP